MARSLTAGTPVPSNVKVMISGDSIMPLTEPSDKAVLWGELFKDRERNFLRKHLKEESFSSTYRDPCFIWYRALWQPNMVLPKMRRHKDGSPAGRVVVLVHPVRGDMTNSWAWVKLMMPLYEQGFSVLAIDLPGCGKSCVASQPRLRPEAWHDDDWRVLSDLLRESNVRGAQFVAAGDACEMVLRLLLMISDDMPGSHVFLNPTFTMDSVFRGYLAPGALLAPYQIRQFKENRSRKILSALLGNHVQIYGTFDQATMSRTVEARQHFEFWAKKSSGASAVMTEITKDHMCEAQAGAKVPVRILFLSRQLKGLYADFLGGLITAHSLPALLSGPAEPSTAAPTDRSHLSVASKQSNAGYDRMRLSATTMRFVPDVGQIASGAHKQLETMSEYQRNAVTLAMQSADPGVMDRQRSQEDVVQNSARSYSNLSAGPGQSRAGRRRTKTELDVIEEYVLDAGRCQSMPELYGVRDPSKCSTTTALAGLANVEGPGGCFGIYRARAAVADRGSEQPLDSRNRLLSKFKMPREAKRFSQSSPKLPENDLPVDDEEKKLLEFALEMSKHEYNINRKQNKRAEFQAHKAMNQSPKSASVDSPQRLSRFGGFLGLK